MVLPDRFVSIFPCEFPIVKKKQGHTATSLPYCNDYSIPSYSQSMKSTIIAVLLVGLVPVSSHPIAETVQSTITVSAAHTRCPRRRLGYGKPSALIQH